MPDSDDGPVPENQPDPPPEDDPVEELDLDAIIEAHVEDEGFLDKLAAKLQAKGSGEGAQPPGEPEPQPDTPPSGSPPPAGDLRSVINDVLDEREQRSAVASLAAKVEEMTKPKEPRQRRGVAAWVFGRGA